MKIENKVYNNHTTFEELNRGDVFIYEEQVCMKTDGNDDESNGVDLENGYTMKFFNDDEVRLVTATLIIE